MGDSKRDFDDLLKRLAAPAADSVRGESDTRPSFPDGCLLAKRFRVLRLLARGGMGEVYEVEDQLRGGRRALKCLLPHITSAKSFARFELESQAVTRIGHANLVQVSDVGVLEDGRPFLWLRTPERALAGQRAGGPASHRLGAALLDHTRAV